MFSHIKTSKENKEVITKLTNKLNLGAENVIARIALAYSLEQDDKLDLKDLKDSGGKEYSKSVLFGENYDLYLGLICSKYQIHQINKDVLKYFKLHLDKGLQNVNAINSENSDTFDIILSLI